MTLPHPAPTLSELVDKTAAEWTVEEIQAAAKSALDAHAPDRDPLTWTKRWGVLPWPHRHHANCVHCGDTYPCITHRYAAQLLSAGRLTVGRAVEVDNEYPEHHLRLVEDKDKPNEPSPN